jgi:hypothetical protein
VQKALQDCCHIHGAGTSPWNPPAIFGFSKTTKQMLNSQLHPGIGGRLSVALKLTILC